MKQAAEEWKRFVHRYGKLMLLSAAAAVVCFGFQAFNGNIRIDTEELVNAPGSTLGWLYIGRYGLVLLKRILGLTVHQVIKSGILMLLFFILGGVLATYGCYHFSGEKEEYPYWLFLLLYITSNIWSFQFYFSLQQAEIALAMMLLIAAAIGMCHCCLEKNGKQKGRRLRLLWFLAAGVFLVLGLASYQAMAVFYIAFCTIFFLLHILRVAEEGKENGQNLWAGVALIIVHFCFFYAVYTVIADTWFMAAGDYMEGQRNWGTQPVIECVKNILRVARNQLYTVGPRNFSFYTIGIPLTIYAVVKTVKQKRFQRKQNLVLFVAAMLLLLASPFLMTVYSGAMLVTRTQFALPEAAAFLAMYGLWMLEKDGGKNSIWANIVRILGIAVLCLQIGYNLRLHEADRLRYAHDTKLAETVVSALQESVGGELAELPVLFVGYRKPELGWFGRRSEMYGWSFFEWDYSKDNPTGATHRIDGFIKAYTGVSLNGRYTGQMQREAAELSEAMGVFPMENSICKTEEFVVVKLSETEERTDIDWW